MIAAVWGCRGSIPTPGARTHRYGGNTSCVEVRTAPRSVIVLDAGTGIRDLGDNLPADTERVDVLLTHLHMDHIIGLGFFAPLFVEDLEIHIWGPASAVSDLRGRLSRYLSPPLFPVRLRDLPCDLHLHDLPERGFAVPGAAVDATLVCHPGPTVGFRIESADGTLAYLPDHEPALAGFGRMTPRWTSGFDLARDADVLFHDSQYRPDEYASKVGWGHSTIDDAFRFAEFCRARCLVAFHHDPTHDDDEIDRLYAGSDVVVAREGRTLTLKAGSLEIVG